MNEVFIFVVVQGVVCARVCSCYCHEASSEVEYIYWNKGTRRSLKKSTMIADIVPMMTEQYFMDGVLIRVKKHKCVYCNKLFLTKYDVKRHLPCSHQSQEVKENQSHRMPKEIRTELIKVKKHKCSYCNKAFVYPSDLKTHLHFHPGAPVDRKHVCSYCSKTFPYSSKLINHLRMHTREKPFSCEVCKKSFAWKSYLKYHLRSQHGEKQFSCNICGKSFVLKSSLELHSRFHLGLQPSTSK